MPGNLCSAVPASHPAHPDYVEPVPPDTDHAAALREKPRRGMSRLAAIVAFAQLGMLSAPTSRDP